LDVFLFFLVRPTIVEGGHSCATTERNPFWHFTQFVIQFVLYNVTSRQSMSYPVDLVEQVRFEDLSGAGPERQALQYTPGTKRAVPAM
jgi:hypothetical protein